MALKDKKRWLGGRRIYEGDQRQVASQKRGIIALAHGDGVEEQRQHTCFLSY